MMQDAIRTDNDGVVITGLGLATSLGLGVDETWKAIIAGRSGAGAMTEMESTLPSGKDGCQAAALPDDFEPILPREARYLRWTILAALRDAGLSDRLMSYEPSRSAVMLG